MTARPLVWFVHEPLRRDERTGQMVPQYDVKPAAEFGDIVFALPGRSRPPMDPETCLIELREAMREFKASDYLAIAGDHQLVIWGAILAERASGGILNLLKWDNREHRYVLFAGRV